MKKIRVAINGFGRIGRAFFKMAIEKEEIEIIAVNDLSDINNTIYLLKYDTVYGKNDLNILLDQNSFTVNDKKIIYLSEKDPTKLPWKDISIDVVVESTGLFTSYEKSKAHLEAGAKRVVISAPAKDNPLYDTLGATVLMGINDDLLKTCQISSNASCTTNAGSPVLEVLRETVGIKKAMLNTIHGYTSSQKLVDSPSLKDFRRGRAGAQNIIPSSTGAAIATAKAIPEMSGLFDGIAIRVPVISGSLVDITLVSKRNTSVEEINEIFKKASTEERWKEILTTTEEPIVSSDIIGNRHASIVDLNFTKVVDGDLVKILAWYDNEAGYAHTLVKHVIKTGGYLG